jgi:hypothetical protein
MKATTKDFDLPPITTPDRPPPLVSTEAALRWRIAKHRGSQEVRMDKPQGEPFVWIESTASSEVQP